MLSATVEYLRVLIWGKTYPELSDRHKETVCTGGCFENGRPVRLYPVPLRYLPEISRYRLYNWVEVPLVKSKQDTRPESYRLARPELRLVGAVGSDPGWIGRRETVYADRSWHYECVEDLKVEERQRRTSMGFVPVGAIEKVWLETRPESDRAKHEEKLRRLMERAKQGDIFATAPEAVKALAFQPHRVHLKWRCSRLTGPKPCPGHTAGVLDWGLGELGRRDGWDVALRRMEALADLNEHDLALYVGNFKGHPTSFGIVGLWYPKRRDTPRWTARQAQGSLF